MGLLARGGGGGEKDERDAADGEGGTRWCLECGKEWVDQLDDCPECDVPLVDENPFLELPTPAEGKANVEYELDDWSSESRVMLDQLLTGASLAHSWQGARLVVAEEDETAVDELVEQVVVTTLPTLDASIDHVGFALDDWDDDRIERLGELLDEAGIAWELDVEGELVVHAYQADEVEALLDGVDHPDALPIDDDDGAADGDTDDDAIDIDPDVVLGGLFVACDRLAKDSRDHRGVLAAAEHARTLASARPPYGFATGTWSNLTRRSGELLALLEDDDSTDDQVELAAVELRVVLRGLV